MGIDPAVWIFLAFVGLTLGISFYLGRQASSSQGYFAAHGQIPWFVNGVAFAGDYLSAASFLGICGLIAFKGYDGFLYSIGFLAGWIVALFVVAEPMKRLGKFTFADALNHRFDSPGIKIAAGVSTLAVSVFYLIPQMVGAGALVYPLLGWPPWAGVVVVGAVVILIVVTAGMVSTTWVQFLKGSLLVIFSAVLTVLILGRGFTVTDRPIEQQVIVRSESGVTVNGQPADEEAAAAAERPISEVVSLPDGEKSTGPLGPLEFFSTLQNSEVVLWTKDGPTSVDGVETTTYTPTKKPGADVMKPGEKFTGIRSDKLVDKLNFLSLMLALFCGTASLPHILIRYYTVRDEAAARKSTIVGIACIGFFYVLTLYLGLGAMTSGEIFNFNSNMAAPLLAKTIDPTLFAIISAIAFTTVLGTVSGLILASAGAVAHDLVETMAIEDLTDHQRVRIAKIASVVVGAIAIALGIVFETMNVGYLVGWAFSVAASANLPALVMLLFWERTTKQGIIAAILMGMVSSLAWILLSEDTFTMVYGLESGWLTPFSQPGIVTIPLGFLTLVVVSLMTPRHEDAAAA
ncbi:Cation/acetate symporter ActP [Posidoniimonas polymericola]|uniref:Cation/acetate symporter ActP n=1 Tax=Posidoniimonas polymericola TaxID=2528002 RepID=A0A5C5ZDW5_9BACT|nr:cation acetate symporter [Posidoniimonas polymericola]TWT85355.1 Cation/acetate symporter ActP [Posidoniimonas polymericola]